MLTRVRSAASALQAAAARERGKRMIPRLSTAMIALSLALLAVLELREATASAPSIEQPLIVQRDQGEVRLWRPLPGGVRSLRTFTIKIDRQNGGSPDFWFVSSEIPSGAAIREHRHLYQDEVLFIDSGVARVHVGNLQGDAHAGTMVFIPRDTWVSVKNIGTAAVALRAGFNAPGFDRFMRCESVAAGQSPTLMSPQEDRRCQKLGDIEYR